MSVKIKICGLTRECDIDCAVNSGADYTGFIFYKKSPRYIDFATLKKLDVGKRVKKVGVFVNEDICTIKDIYEKAKLDVVQIHGDEPPKFCESLDITYWKAFRVGKNFDIEVIGDYNCDTIVIDAYSENSYGGTGKRVDIKSVEKIIEKFSNKKVIVAGGVSVGNIAEIVALKPYGVDINSSVEIKEGIKDCAKIREIIGKIK